MEIAIRSECDSRILLYPLIKVLYNYGTVAVYTSNRFLSRLIENELEGGFRNVRVIVNTESDLEEAKMSDEYFKNKYDFVIFDNMGATDYDTLICIVTNRLSESFVSDLVYIAKDEKTRIIKFGNPAAAVADKSNHKSSKSSKEENSEDDDSSFNKWDQEKTDEETLTELLQDKDLRWCKFPSYDAIELMESRFQMIIPDDTLIKELYKILGKSLSVDERQFTKGARLKDEGCSLISGTDVR